MAAHASSQCPIVRSDLACLSNYTIKIPWPLQTYSPAAEVLVQQAKAPGADGGAYINAAKQEVPAPQARSCSLPCRCTALQV